MKTSLSLIITLFYSSIMAQTVVPGGTISGTWTKSGSPYLVQGNLLIPNGATLTINPGVTVNFQGNYILLVSGRLLATGIAADSIRFTAANTSTGWQGIRFENIAVTNDSSKITFCSIKYGYVNNGNGGGIYVSNFSKLFIYQSLIANCTATGGFGGGIYLSSSDAIISDNTISSNHSVAGGIYINGGSPVIRGNYVFNNDNVLPPVFPDPGDDPDNYGGGISCYNSTATIINNTITSNNSKTFGGGVVANQGSPTIVLNNIFNNRSAQNGGGIYCSGSLILTDNIISNNSSEASGGGIYYFEASGDPLFSKNRILNNTAVASGGGMVSYAIKAAITYNIFSNNSLTGSGTPDEGGGAISFINCDASTNVSNNIIVNNSSVNGGALLFNSANPVLSNNTVSNNSAAKGGALYCVNSSPALVNMLLWGNTASGSGAQVFLYDDASDPAISFSNIPGGTAVFSTNGNFYTGAYQSNIDVNPLFVSPSGGSGTGFNGAVANWGLQNGSPVINKGKPGGIYPATDYAGNIRVVSGVIDIGAVENQTGIPPAAKKTLFLDKVTNICSPTFNLSVRTKGITNVVGLQGTISWNPSLIKFSSIIYDASAINITAADLNLNNTSNGYLTFSWLDNSLAGKSTTDSTKIFTIQFDKSNITGGSTAPVTFNSLHTPLEIDTINMVTGTPIIAADTAFINGSAGFALPPSTEFLSLSDCDSLKYNSRVYYTSTQVRDTLKYVQNQCDSLYKVVDIVIFSTAVPTVSIAADQNNIVYGTTVTFTANATYSGQTPVFEWFKNGVFINGVSGSTYTSATLNVNDTIRVKLKSSISCAAPDTAFSNKIVMLVNYIVSGQVKNPAGIVIPNVTVNITGHINSSLNTGMSGVYSAPLPGGYNYVVRPYKNNDINRTNGVSTLDVALIQSHILNTNLFNSPYKLIAADVNSSGNISALDILYIRRLILGLDNSFPGNRLWAFADTSSNVFNPLNPLPYKDNFSFTGLFSNKTNQNFISVKLGDVNFDWNASLLRPLQPVAKPISFYYNDITVNQGAEIRVPVRVKNFKDVLGMQFTLNYNSNVLQLKSIENNRLNIQYATNRVTEGKVPFIWNDGSNRLSTLNDNDVLMELVFLEKAIFSEEDISLTSDIAGIEAWDGSYTKHTIIKGSGKIKKAQKNSVVYTTENWTVAPNPTQGITQVNFQLKQAKNIRIELVNTDGKILISQSLQLPKGASNVSFNLQRDQHLAAGVYFLKVNGMEGNSLKKVVLVK